jgi:SAM-dependent methyltransferase
MPPFAARLGLIALVFLVILPGCKPSQPVDAPEANLTLILPEFYEYLDRDPPRRNKIKIDGVETILSPDLTGKKWAIKAAPAPGKDSVEVELSFWPASYSNTFRYHTVKLKANEEVTLDLTKPGPDKADRFEAIYFPAPQALTEAQMNLAGVTDNDTVLDIGCGDGRLVIMATKRFKAKKGVGIDIREELVELSAKNAKEAGVADRCVFRHEDALKMTDLSPYSVVYLYLGEDLSAQLLPLLQKTLKPGARVVSNTFRIGDWAPDKTQKVTCTNNYGKEQTFQLYLWTVK